MKLLFMTTIKK